MLIPGKLAHRSRLEFPSQSENHKLCRVYVEVATESGDPLLEYFVATLVFVSLEKRDDVLGKKFATHGFVLGRQAFVGITDRRSLLDAVKRKSRIPEKKRVSSRGLFRESVS